jgi:hypothetical protein
MQSLSAWYDESLLMETPILRGSIFGWFFGLMNQAAVTINRTIHLTGKPPGGDLSTVSGVALIGHELYHVKQQQEMGWWPFLLRYTWYWRPRHIKNGAEHPMEKYAYDRGREIEKALGG